MCTHVRAFCKCVHKYLNTNWPLFVCRAGDTRKREIFTCMLVYTCVNSLKTTRVASIISKFLLRSTCDTSERGHFSSILVYTCILATLIQSPTCVASRNTLYSFSFTRDTSELNIFHLLHMVYWSEVIDHPTSWRTSFVDVISGVNHITQKNNSWFCKRVTGKGIL